MTMRRIALGETTLAFHDSGMTITSLPDGKVVNAYPEETDYQKASAKSLGYGEDLLTASREHEAAHAILSHLLGLKESPTFRGVVDGHYWPEWKKEESAVLALQAFARACGVSLLDVAERLASK